MKRAFDLLDQVPDVVHAQPGPEGAEVPSLYRESFSRSTGRGECQAAAQRVVDHIPEGSPRSPRQRRQFRRHILIKRQRRPHAVMLVGRHHDVKRQVLRQSSRGAPTSAGGRCRAMSGGSWRCSSSRIRTFSSAEGKPAHHATRAFARTGHRYRLAAPQTSSGMCHCPRLACNGLGRSRRGRMAEDTSIPRLMVMRTLGGGRADLNRSQCRCRVGDGLFDACGRQCLNAGALTR